MLTQEQKRIGRGQKYILVQQKELTTMLNDLQEQLYPMHMSNVQFSKLKIIRYRKVLNGLAQ